MEINGIKKVMVSLMMLIMIVVAQGRAAYQPNTSTKECAEKCGLQCATKGAPPVIALCFGICMLECEIIPAQDVLDCTKTCAKSAVYSNPQADDNRVQGYIESCYGKCKNEM